MFKSFIRIFFFFGLMVSGQFVFAVDYYWTSSPTQTGQHSTPAAACLALAQTYPVSGIDPSRTQISKVANTRFTCRFYVTATDSFYPSTSYRSDRAGSTCPPSSVYNSDIGACEAPEPDACESTAGQNKSHEHETYAGIGFARSEPPGSICENSCQFAFTDSAASDCYRFVDGSKEGRFCKYQYKGNGVSCTSDNPQPGSVFDQPPTKPPIARDPTLEKDSTCDQWVTGADGVATRQCTSSEKYTEPGLLNCENSNGLVGCTPGKPSPALSEKLVDQVITKTTNADGSVTTTTTTTTTTGCYGNKPCTTQSSVKTDKSTEDAEGNPAGEESTCTGSLCGSGLDTDPTKDPDDLEDDVERSATVGTCDVALACDGDPIDCAILQQQKEQLCHAEEQSDFEGKKSDIASLFDGEQFELDTSDIQAPSFINQGTRFFPSSSCPAPQTISLTSNGGHTFRLSYEPICSFASDFSFLIVIMAGIWCAAYVGRAFGGE